MKVFANIDFINIANSVICFALAFVLGGIIGIERQYRQRTAGLRTNVLVAVGAAVFVNIGDTLSGDITDLRVIAYVVSGIGFLGAGVIMREEGHVRGLNTAATLWGSAAVGAAAGSSLVIEACIASIFVVSANTLLRPIVNKINRTPLVQGLSEVTNTLNVIVTKYAEQRVMELLTEELESLNYPIQDIEIRPFNGEDQEIEVKLVDAAVEEDKLDALIYRLISDVNVRQAFWHPSTSE